MANAKKTKPKARWPGLGLRAITKNFPFASWFVSLVAFLLTGIFSAPAFAQGTAFTYQGRLNTGATGATGLYDFQFKLFADAMAATQIGGGLVTNGVAVTNGLFTVTLDFGAGVFAGNNRWLELSVKTNGAGIFTALRPLQSLTPAPYAVFAGSASNLAGGVSLAQLPSAVLTNNAQGISLSGNFTGNGGGLTGLRASDGGAVASRQDATNATTGLMGFTAGISDLALLNINQPYRDGWLDAPIGFNTWYGVGPYVNQNYITNYVAPAMMGLIGPGGDARVMLAPKRPYVLIDDGLFTGFDTNGIPTLDTNKWPSGFPWLCDYVHSNGLAIGIWMQAYYGTFNTQMPNYNAFIFAKYLLSNHVDYVKFDGVYQTPDDLLPYDALNTNLLVLCSYLRTAQYPIHLSSGAGDGGTNVARKSRVMSLLDSFRSTGIATYDKMGNVVVGDIIRGGQRPILQNQWVDAAMGQNYFFGNGLAPDFDPLSSGNWPDAKRHLFICTFFSSSFQWGEGIGVVWNNFENVWSNMLSETSLKIRRDQFRPLVAYYTNGVELIKKENTAGGVDVLLLNRNYDEGISPAGYLGKESYGPGFGLDLFTNYWPNNGTNFQYVFRATNAAVNFAALGLRGNVYSVYNAATDARLTVTNGFSLTVPAASAQLFRLVPPVAEPAYRWLAFEKWFEYTNYTAFPNYPFRNNLFNSPTFQFIGSPEIFSNGMFLAPGSRVTYGVNGAQTFSATFGANTAFSAFVNNVGIFLDETLVGRFHTGTLTNFSCAIPPGTKTISIQGDTAGEYYFVAKPLLTSRADGSYLTGLAAADGNSVASLQQVTNTLATGAFTVVGNAAVADTNTMKVRAATYADFSTVATNAPDGNRLASTNQAAALALNIAQAVVAANNPGGNGYLHPVNALAYTGGTNVMVDCSLADHFKLFVTNHVFFILTNLPVNQDKDYFLKTRLDATGGWRITWQTNSLVPRARFSGGVSPANTTNANAEDAWQLLTDFSGSNVNVILNPNFK